MLLAPPRRVEPEWLDALQPDDPRARRARRDLLRVNAWMRQAAIMAYLLKRYGPASPRAILDLGAGDGAFMLRVARRLCPAWRGVRVILLDRHDLLDDDTRAGFRACGWQAEAIAADVLRFLDERRLGQSDIVTANLFLHHFADDGLRALLAGASRLAPLFVACEPARTPLALLASRLVGVIGCNEVSRHDALLSVRAGFRGRELSRLWPREDAWRLREAGAFPFTHCFVAQRLASTTRPTHGNANL